MSVRRTPHRNHVHKQSEKTTRVRTVLNEKQLHTLRTCYNANPRPDALMKEQLVEMTGLSARGHSSLVPKQALQGQEEIYPHETVTTATRRYDGECLAIALSVWEILPTMEKIQTLTNTALSDAWHLIWAEMILIGSIIRLQCWLEANYLQTPPTVFWGMF